MAIALSDGIAVEAWVRRSCDEQGLSIQVTDLSVLRQVVNIMNGSGMSMTTVTPRRRRHAKKGDTVAHRGPPEFRGARAQEGAAVAPGSPIF